MLNLLTNPYPVSLDEMIKDILKCDVCLFGEEGHWYPNILEKEKTIALELNRTQQKKLIFALECDIDTNRELEIYASYVGELVDFLSKLGVVVSLEPGETGFRGIRMAKKIIELLNRYRGCLVVPIVGANHITDCGSEIPAELKREFMAAHLDNDFVRVLLKTATAGFGSILKGFSIHGTIYYI